LFLSLSVPTALFSSCLVPTLLAGRLDTA
jgi:hypothetical protein